jgi:Cupin
MIKTLVLALAAASSVSAAPAQDQKALFADLYTAPSSTDRFQRLLVDPASGALLPADQVRSAIVFDYNNGASLDPTDTAGIVTAAVAKTFPILVDQDISTVVGFMGPCSLLQPHTHPVLESLVVTEGQITTGNLIPGLVTKGTGEIVEQLNKLQGTVFPAGAIHYEYNSGCKNATFVASLASSDPGTTLEATFFSLSGDVVAATLGFPDSVIDGKTIDQVRAQLPPQLVFGVQQCLKKCNISH